MPNSKGIITKGKELGLSDKAIEDLLYNRVQARPKKDQRTGSDAANENWAGKVKARDSPYNFADPAEFQRFTKDLIEKVRATGLPVTMSESRFLRFARDRGRCGYRRICEQSVFDKLLIDRFDGRITKGSAKVPLAAKPTRSWLKCRQT